MIHFLSMLCMSTGGVSGEQQQAPYDTNVQVSKQLSSSAAVLKAGPPPIEKPAVLTAADLEKPVCIRLEETETLWLLHLPGGCINADTDEGKAVETANSKWAVLQQRNVLWISSFAASCLATSSISKFQQCCGQHSASE